MSRLARALWIEISMVHIEWNLVSSRGSREPCGLKFEFQCLGLLDCDGRGSREPCGLKFHVENGIKEADNRRGSREPCGLKYCAAQNIPLSIQSRLARALWIEIAIL